MLDAWSRSSIDPQRAKRLLVGASIGAALLFSGGYAAVAMVHQPSPPKPEKKKERIIENVSLVEEPAGGGGGEPPPDAVPQPSLAPIPVAPVVQPKAVKAQRFDYADDSPPAGAGGGSGNGSGHGTGSGMGAAPSPPPTPPPPAPPPPRAAPPKPKAPAAPDPADYDPPKCKKRGIDKAAAKAAGVEGKVVVSYTVTASGAVTNVRAVSGPAELQPLAVAAVQAWSCEPARMKADGGAIVVTKKVPLTVTLK
jgi:TonB family protein